MKTLTKLSIVMLLAGFVALNSNAQNVGEAAPDFTLDKLDGGTFTLSEQSGKVVFIFFFGNSCSHCRANGPNTQTDIYSVFMDNPDFVAVGIDTWNGEASSVQSYKSTTGIEYPLLLKGASVQSSYQTTYDRIVVVDKEGIIQFKSNTNADKSTTGSANTVVDFLLNEGTSSTNLVVANEKPGQFVLTPNIVREELRITNPFEDGSLANARIIDITGKVVQTEFAIDTDETVVNIGSLTPGYYAVVLRAGPSEYKTARFIKVR